MGIPVLSAAEYPDTGKARAVSDWVDAYRAVKDDREYQRALEGGTYASLLAYLTSHPEGRHRPEIEAEVARRMAADPAAPERVTDQGYPAGTCVSPADDTVSALSMPAMGSIGIRGGVLCDNTTAGRRVLAWREWFCRGFETEADRVRDCVVAWWQDGYRAPRLPPNGYGYTVDTNFEIRMSPAVTFIVAPPKWQPAVRP